MITQWTLVLDSFLRILQTPDFTGWNSSSTRSVDRRNPEEKGEQSTNAKLETNSVLRIRNKRLER